MDTTAQGIEFDENGRCNFCREFEIRLASHKFYADGGNDPAQLNAFLAKVRADGADKPYDCIVGVSGGLDSSWVLHEAKRLGLRPLAVHMDNGWDSELAVNNIASLIEKLDVDLFTYVIDWDEYKRLMQAFFDADVLDVELLYDNAMLAVCYQEARKYRLKYILSGSNLATEGMRMPTGWSWRDKRDTRNIVAIGRSQKVKIKSLPMFSNWDLLVHQFVHHTERVSFLDYLGYTKEKALDHLVENFGYKPYPYKHYESVFTRFYQGFILPRKFGVDKRKVHLSSLIVTHQLTRGEAVKLLEHIPYPSEEELDRDITYFLKKLGWKREQLDDYIARPERPHDAFPTDPVPRVVWPVLRWVARISKPFRKVRA